MFEHVFAPIRIRDMELKNRIILPAMGTRMADENGAVTDKLICLLYTSPSPRDCS